MVDNFQNVKVMTRRILTALLPFLLLGVFGANVALNAPLLSDAYLRSDRLGITFINSVDTPDSEERYQRALALGAGWNRWPLYWNRVEVEEGEFDWAAYDAVVMADLEHGLKTDVILLGMPEFYRDENTIIHLQEAIFADGTDSPRADKRINPDNPWANFVYQAVQRYRPDGELAKEQGWQDGRGVRVWEIWNEPDDPSFWNGGIPEYARMLKVAHVVAHNLDPDTTVMFGGLLYSTGNNWLSQVLAIYQDDPFRERDNWYMDAVAIHNYGDAWRSGWLTLVVRQTFVEYEFERPIWLNETGVAAWDDYPGPTWLDDDPSARQARATAEQQAAFFVQSSAYAWAQGARTVFYHQLYDDCGNQAPGTDFLPDDGESFGDAFGLYRNRADSVCFSHHAQPDTPRPAARAFSLLANVFGGVPFSRRGVINDERDDGAVIITFSRPTTDERIVVMWNTKQEPLTLELPAGGAAAGVVTLDHQDAIAPRDEVYTIDLPAADMPNQRYTASGSPVNIGGNPVILIEKLTPELAAALEFQTFESSEPVRATVTPIPSNALSQAELDELVANSPTGAVFTSLNVARVRTAPNTTSSTVVGTLQPTNSATIIGRTEDDSWVQIDYLGQQLWVASFLGQISGELDPIPVIFVPTPAPTEPSIDAPTETPAGDVPLDATHVEGEGGVQQLGG
jgi:hypothetical protein